MAVSNLSPWQQMLATKFGKRAPSDQELRQAADEFFGPIPIPPGSQIVRQDGGYAEWIDPEGYRHSATRQLDGRSPNAGQLSDNTDRPNVLPQDKTATPEARALTAGVQGLSAEQIANLTAAARGERPKALDPGIDSDLAGINSLAGRLQNPQGFGQIDPQTQAYLDEIRKADEMRNAEQFDKQQSRAIADLYGNRVNQSSIAGQNIAQLLQAQGLVSAQTNADAAGRNIAVQQYLQEAQRQRDALALNALLGGVGAKLEGFNASTGAAQNQTNALLDYLKSLNSNQTQRDLGEANIDLGRSELAERGRQANLGFELNQQEADLRLKQANSTWNKIMQGINAATSIAGAASGAGGAASAFSRIFTGRTTAGAPPVGGDGGYG